MSEAMLYFAPYVMPDGSKRRALVDRVPECRPRALECVPSLSPALWAFRGSKIDVEVAAALCRCCVTDWLDERGITVSRVLAGPFQAKARYSCNTPIIPCPANESQVSSYIRGAETIHAALVMVAQLEADAGGREP